LTCATAGLRRATALVTVTDQRSFHLFQPLFYQVVIAALSPADIAMPIRRILRRQRNTSVALGRAEAVDRGARTVRTSLGDRPIAYDCLVVATGARPSYFGHDDWSRVALALKRQKMPSRFATAFCWPSSKPRQ